MLHDSFFNKTALAKVMASLIADSCICIVNFGTEEMKIKIAPEIVLCNKRARLAISEASDGTWLLLKTVHKYPLSSPF